MVQTYEERLAYNREWIKKNPEQRKIQNAHYRQKNRDLINSRQNKRWKEKSQDPSFRQQINQKALKRVQSILEEWIGFIPKETDCQCCGRRIIFASQNKKDAIHFDHRNGKAKHIISPTNWLKRNRRTSENEVLWTSFDFGMLCKDCNLILPTENREQFVSNFVKYVKGS